MAGGDALARALDGFAAACYHLRRSDLARWIFIALVVVALGLMLFTRPGQLENQTVREVAIGDISIASVNTYVRVSGVLDPTGAYRTSYNLGGFELYGSRYIPLMKPGTPDAIWVADENLPARDSGGYVTLVAQVMMGQGMQQPTLYLQVGYPPNVILANLLSRLGSVLLIVLWSRRSLGNWLNVWTTRSRCHGTPAWLRIRRRCFGLARWAANSTIGYCAAPRAIQRHPARGAL